MTIHSFVRKLVDFISGLIDEDRQTNVKNVSSFNLTMDFVVYFLSYIALPGIIILGIWELYSSVVGRAHVKKFFNQKVVLIIGASSGLGEAIAMILHLYNAKLILVSRNIDKLNDLKRDLMSSYPQGPTPFCVRLDLEKLEDIKIVADGMIEIFGNIDVVINNAGISYRGRIIDTELSVYQRLMNINYIGHVELIKALLKHFVATKSGSVVGITSVQSQISIPYRSAYASSKHAFLAFLDCLRAELFNHKRINVLSVNPGYIKTNLSLNALAADGSAHNQMDKNQLKGMSPCDVALRIASAIAYRKKYLTIAPFYVKMLIIIRTLFPGFYFYIMSKRASSQAKDYADKNSSST